MIPSFGPDGNLPAGMHRATWLEVAARYGGTQHRRTLLTGMERALASLRRAGCRIVYLDGGFVTAKSDPADFDGCWDITGVDRALVDPTLIDPDDLEQGRLAQKARFGGELFPAVLVENALGQTFLDFFQIDRAIGARKGIVAIHLQEGEQP